MGVQSVSSQGPRIVALHSQILFTLQVIQIFHKNLDILGAIFYENLWTFCVLSFFWNIFLDLKIDGLTEYGSLAGQNMVFKLSC